MNQVCGRNLRMKWTTLHISELPRNIQELKLNGLSVLGAYHKLIMVTVHWHMIDHVGDYIVRNGGLYLCHEGLYEY